MKQYKYAVIGDGTGCHEHFVTTVMADSAEQAIEKVARSIIDCPDDAAVEATEIGNFGSPTYCCDLLNEDGEVVYELKTAPLNEMD